MCMEDIRIGRQVSSQTIGTGTADRILSPNRFRIALTVTMGAIGGLPEIVLIYSGRSTAGQTLYVLNSFAPAVTLRIEDWGQLLTGELFITTSTGNSFYVTEHVLTKE